MFLGVICHYRQNSYAAKLVLCIPSTLLIVTLSHSHLAHSVIITQLDIVAASIYAVVLAGEGKVMLELGRKKQEIL